MPLEGSYQHFIETRLADKEAEPPRLTSLQVGMYFEQLRQYQRAFGAEHDLAVQGDWLLNASRYRWCMSVIADFLGLSALWKLPLVSTNVDSQEGRRRRPFHNGSLHNFLAGPCRRLQAFYAAPNANLVSLLSAASANRSAHQPPFMPFAPPCTVTTFYFFAAPLL